MATWDDVAAVVARLPETSEGTSYGQRAWRFRKTLLAWARPLRAGDRAALGDAAPAGELLGLKTADLDEKADLLAVMPEVFLTIPHFQGHAVVLARLEDLPLDVLERLVHGAFRRAAPERLVAALGGGAAGAQRDDGGPSGSTPA